ncbi:response regulator transcription factor [Streptomyces natalensis]|uniref:LuxR family transcriptional regulator n=1 Tax=Streptomyces natalensis ATCC 27448 TaxID=1240678 RepID=A0A0D7CQU8_9ACTN|nr:response regulator transcription factor [Streptomyces natalensis]KIZ17772.1 LuxR family transcriptional regulator [Streptomyces natalensis ATCC 27448]
MTTQASIRVIVADDQAAVREGLVLLLGTMPGITVVAEAGDGAEAVAQVAEHRPDVVLMDLGMPNVTGAEATSRVRRDHPGTQVVVLTTYASEDLALEALSAGALGYLTKSATKDAIARALSAAAAGQAVLDPGVQRTLIQAATRGRPVPAPADGLTVREIDVLKLIAAGCGNRDISRRLFISEPTVKTHINRIFAKTGSKDRAQAIRYAQQHRYADTDTDTDTDPV